MPTITKTPSRTTQSSVCRSFLSRLLGGRLPIAKTNASFPKIEYFRKGLSSLNLCTRGAIRYERFNTKNESLSQFLRLASLCLSFVLVSCSLGGNPSPTLALPTPSPSPLPTAVLAQSLGDLQGSHDGNSAEVDPADCRAVGWAVDSTFPENVLTVRVLVDGVEVTRTLADQPRVDLTIGERCPKGACSFDVDLMAFVQPDIAQSILVQVQDPALGIWIDLESSPQSLICAGSGVSGGAEPVITTDPSGRVKFAVGDAYLILEFLDDDLVHFEWSGVPTPTDLGTPLPVSPMVAKTDYSGPSSLTSDGQGAFETADLIVDVDPVSLCLTAADKTRQPPLPLSTICPHNLALEDQAVTLTPESFTHAYGLGEAFSLSGPTTGDWIGRVRASGNAMGNAMVGWNGGGVGNAQFPVVYFAGSGLESYALFADNAYAQRWDFSEEPWHAEMGGNWLRFYLMSGPDFRDLRTDYLELVGRPTVPPKKMFGLWISEYGYDNWDELENKLATLRQDNFPLDGFVLDLQWFGGVVGSSDNTPMGSLSWDTSRFPDPAAKIANLKEEGLGIIVIEEPYIGRGLPEHADLQSRGFLATACSTCPSAAYLTSNPWWGQGGLLDYTNPAAGVYWHDLKREPLIEAGVLGHWTDLGEPEMFDPNAFYGGILGDYTSLESHMDIHNLYNLLWSKSVFEGYQRNEYDQRPFILSRSGAPGSQRYGVSMWSGDIGSNLTSLSAHINVQMHMSFSGMDYFGSDIGGFHRGGLDGDLDEMYTRWFAVGTLMDIPVRAHTENLCNCKETAPDRIGDLQANLQAIRLRYTLSPYLYSLSHRAWLFAEPVYPPLVYAYQSDQNVREISDEKMIGEDLLVKLVSEYGITETRVYLPAGDWFNYHTLEHFTSSGEWFESVPLLLEGVYTLPLFARAGSIIPQMVVDERTLNISGLRSDGTLRDELVVRVFSSNGRAQFTLYEDDGQTIAYQQGVVQTTLISWFPHGGGYSVTIDPGQGSYNGAPDQRAAVVEYVEWTPGQISNVSLDGEPLVEYPDKAALDAAPSGWVRTADNLVIAKSAPISVGTKKDFFFGFK